VTAAPVVIRDAAIVADYVASVRDHYEHESARPWTDVVDDVSAAVRRAIDTEGRFVVTGEVGAFVCC
jgi:hypothetical protein